MPCTAKTFECHIYTAYLKSGNPNYHGELCGGCMFWYNNPDDLAFKIDVGLIFNNQHIEGVKENKKTLDWF